MPAIKVGIQTASLRLPLRKALQTAAQLRADAVELDARQEVRPADFNGTAIRQLRKMLDDMSLRVCALSFRTRRGYDIAEDLHMRVDATKSAMRLAHALGASVVINHIGDVRKEPGEAQFGSLLDVLSDLGRYGQHVGALLAADTGGESGADLACLIGALPSGSLAVNLNPGNLIVNGFSCSDAIAALGPHITHVHAKDGVRDMAQGRGLEVPLGRGSADFPSLLGALEEYNYRGYFTIERHGAQDPVQEIGLAVQYLRNL